MNSTNGFDPLRYELGFELLARKAALKRDLEQSGIEGLTSFVGACIARGICHEDDIKEAAADIAGPYLDASIDEILAKHSACARCRQWHRTAGGRFIPAR